MKRYTVADIIYDFAHTRGWSDSDEVVLATDYDSLLAVLRQCVEAMENDEWCGIDNIPNRPFHVRHHTETRSAALAAAREILDKEATK